MLYELKIVVDSNDADYMTEITKVTMEEILKFQPIYDAIKAKKIEMGSAHYYNWPQSEYRDETAKDVYPNLNPDLIDEFRDYLPHNNADGFHTIKSIEYYPVSEKISLI